MSLSTLMGVVGSLASALWYVLCVTVDSFLSVFRSSETVKFPKEEELTGEKSKRGKSKNADRKKAKGRAKKVPLNASTSGGWSDGEEDDDIGESISMEEFLQRSKGVVVAGRVADKSEVKGFTEIKKRELSRPVPAPSAPKPLDQRQAVEGFGGGRVGASARARMVEEFSAHPRVFNAHAELKTKRKLETHNFRWSVRLHECLEKDDIAGVIESLKAGVDVNMPNPEKPWDARTPLGRAVKMGNIDAFRCITALRTVDYEARYSVEEDELESSAAHAVAQRIAWCRRKRLQDDLAIAEEMCRVIREKVYNKVLLRVMDDAQ